MLTTTTLTFLQECMYTLFEVHKTLYTTLLLERMIACEVCVKLRTICYAIFQNKFQTKFFFKVLEKLHVFLIDKKTEVG